MSKSIKSVQLFLSLGLATTLVAGGTVTAKQTHQGNQQTTQQANKPDSQEEGGEGGEGGEAGNSGNPEVDYMVTLGLMEGHLMAAKELMDKGNYQAATPHIEHPVEELYSEIETALTQHKVPQFKTSLSQLYDLVKFSPQDPKVQQLYKEVNQNIEKAIAAIPLEQRQSPAFILPVINQMLRTAAEEYKAAIADGKIVEAVEYQDSRGFVFYADMLYESIAQAAEQKSPQDAKIIREKLTELKKAWPSIEPPANPVKTSEEVYGLVAEIEFASSNFKSK